MEQIDFCIKAAIAGGETIKNYKASAAQTKGDKFVGHPAITTSADFKSQQAILNILGKDADASFVTEEHVKDANLRKRILHADYLKSMKNRRVYIIDELDGSSSFSTGHYEWATSIGCLDKMQHTAGAIFAPKINGGTLFFGSWNGDAFIRSAGKTQKMKVSECKDMRNAYVIFGPDNVLTKYPLNNKMMTMMGDRARTVNINGSCALALGLVASGKADALIQPLQSPWDWAAGKLLVEEAGGTVSFFEMEQEDGVYEEILPIDELEPKHYNPSSRTVGFVAGNEKMVEEIMDLLDEISS